MMRYLALALALLLSMATPVLADPVFDHAQRADGVRVVPDRFLRGWDPVTVFFDADTGPAAGGPEDAPERWASLQPAIPGAWQWLGPRVLQFRPSEAWQPLRPVGITVSGQTTALVPLLPIPVQTGPTPSQAGVTDLDRIALTFPGPVDRAALARLTTIELRPQPGLSAEGAQMLTAQDFDITEAERAKRGDPQTYVVALHRPIPDGQVALLRLRLSDQPGLDVPSFELRLQSAVPFALTGTDCASGFGNSTQDGARRCAPSDDAGGASLARGLQLRFSAPPEALDIVHARDVLRVSPHVDGLTAQPEENALVLGGKFLADTVYTLQIAPGALKDRRGRGLAPLTEPVRFSFAAPAPGLRWDASQGIVERLGPQMVPLRGQGYDRADLRIHPIDPLSRDFWPYPAPGLVTRDDTPPPLPGKVPVPWDQPGSISADDMAQRIQALGSPSVSELVDLPIPKGGVETKFGLDVAPLLRRIAGAGQPGTYLLGLRPVDAQDRHWIRVQVTDLSLTTVEAAGEVRFTVTSLATAQPVEGAVVELQGVRNASFGPPSFETLQRGTTAADGSFTWSPRQHAGDHLTADLRRIVVTKGADTLVLDPRRGPQQYAQENWTRGSPVWLGWAAAGDLAPRREPARLLCHVYTERPIYRPEEKVLLAGMVRTYQRGGLSFARGTGNVVIHGPSQQEWQLPVTLDDVGGFHISFDATTDETGDYTAEYRPDGPAKDDSAEGCGAMSFKKEAYRLPTFEVLLNGPQKTPLDQPFTVDLLARWFAGGLVADRPIAWRVTQFPYVWSPPGREGFSFSSDSRFTGDGEFRSTPVLSRQGTTDAGGAAQIALDPTIEPTAQPREYVVEATVTGDDDIQVRNIQHVVALPPFVLGVKLPRYIAQPGAIDPDVLAVDADGKPIAGLKMTARLIRRNWNSVLQASDFAAGSAKYDTQVIDETVEERALVSTDDVQHLHFEAKEAGVYIVELTASDRIGRSQTVRVDSFMAGGTPVTWSRPPAQTATVTPDKPSYAPGETATLVIQSPFQTARALAVVEEPEGRFRYDWVDIQNGFGRYTVPVRKQQMPKLAVHFLIMRGRLPGPPPSAAAPFDQGKPTTIAATSWITVTPVENQVKVRFDAPASARPAQEVDLVLHLSDAAGHPLAGEATVWMVDQAVLSLAREQALDPLPQFVVARPSRMVARDTRNLAFGIIPMTEAPGGDGGAEAGVENISVRRNFTPVPIYVPRVMFGPDGTATVHVKLPDTLTVYMLRAKAISGPDRFGFGTGQMRIRQPVVAQPALPRFLRPGDSFQASVIGRLVEGPGGSGTGAISAEGLSVQGPSQQALSWDAGHPARLGFPVTVPEAASGTARIRFLLQRDADKAGDAVQLDLPIQPDRPVQSLRDLQSLAPGAPLAIPALADAARPGTYRRTVTVAADPALVRIIGGLATLRADPFGSTEQRISLAKAELAFKPFAPILDAAGLQNRLAADVAATTRAIGQAVDENGLVAFWPHGHGSVLLTAWAYELLVQADHAGLPVDKALHDRLARVLEQALRSDYPYLFDREAVRERVAALTALAQGGALKPDYAAELARRAVQLPTESLAQIVGVVAALPEQDRALLPGLTDDLWHRVNLRLQDGKSVYGSLTDSPVSPLVLPSEARSLSELMQAVTVATPTEPRLDLLRTGLLGLADGTGWGNTNATGAALRALAAGWQKPGRRTAIGVTLPEGARQDVLDQDHPLVAEATTQPGPISASVAGPSDRLAVLVDTRFVPTGPGWSAKAAPHGFVLTRQLFRVPASGPMQQIEAAADGSFHLAVGDVVEEVDEVVNPEDRTNVAIRLPLAAGMEPMNPNLATAPAEAAPSAGPSLVPDYVSYGDDQVMDVYTALPKGSVTLRMRMRATVEGSFTQPPAQAQTMYQAGIDGSSDGARIVIAR